MDTHTTNFNINPNTTNTKNKLPNILVTGTPGVGKTSLSMLLNDKLNELGIKYEYLNVGIM